MSAVFTSASQLMWHRNTFFAVRDSVHRVEMNTHFMRLSAKNY